MNRQIGNGERATHMRLHCIVTASAAAAVAMCCADVGDGERGVGAKNPPPLKYEFRDPLPKVKGYAPVVPMDDFTIELRDGLILRNGKPFFWVGNGCDLGSAHSTPLGLWLARLAGQTYVTVPDGASFNPKYADGTLTVGGCSISAGNLSWAREAERLGMVVQSTVTSRYFKWSEMRRYTKDHPDFADIHYNAGHYLSIDTGYEAGRRILTAKRRDVFTQFEDDPKYLAEFAREPGPEPCNRRICAAFAQAMERKYGSIDEANRAWRTEFAGWSEVRPPHLPDDAVMKSGYVRKRELRCNAIRDRYEMYMDWLRFAQGDNMRNFAAEVADVRRYNPKIRLTVDVRGHMDDCDSYMMYDVNAVDRLVDYFSIHNGYIAYRYDNERYDENVLRISTAFPLFKYNFFRANTRHPIWNGEDIASVVRSAASTPEAMRRNDLAGLMDGDWDFRRDDAKEWDRMAVPQAWDATDRYKGYSGTAWYRKRFTVDAQYSDDFADGSRRFFFAGRGMAQQGTVWLNGHKVGEVKGWNTPFRLDVGAYLNFGRENELLIRCDGNGGFMNGLRGVYHILAGDQSGEALPFGEKEHKAMLWGYLMRGSSAVSLWNWTGDPFRVYLPELVAKLEEVAEFALPDLRRQHRSRVALLYPYLYARGLPVASCIERGRIWVDWYNAATFSGVEPDVVSEETFVSRVTPEDYPLLLAPAAALVEEKTYAHFKEYLANGGVAIVTEDSFARTYDRFRETGVGAVSGKRIVVDASLSMESLKKAFAPHLPAPEVAFDRSSPIECNLAGTDDRKVLHFQNWDGRDHVVPFTLPDEVKGWSLTPLEGRFDGCTVVLPSQGTAVAILSKDRSYRWSMPEKAAKNAAELKRIAALNVNRPDAAKRALFAAPDGNRGPYTGKALYPRIVEALTLNGYAVDELHPSKWTSETLAKYSLVVLSETQSFPVKDVIGTPMIPSLAEWVKGGGRALMMSYTASTLNAAAHIFRKGDMKPFGFNGVGRLAWSEKYATFGDPAQLTTANVSGPLADGVKSVVCYAAAPLLLLKDSPLKPVVSFPSDMDGNVSGRPVVAVGEIGKGRIVVSSDAFLFQPSRIECADNARLLENVVNYLK